MLLHNIKIAFRNHLKQVSFSIINIGGLALGIACSFVILIYVMQELSYEKHFTDHKQIYRVATKFMTMGEFASGPEILLEVMPGEYQWVEQTCRVEATEVEITYGNFTATEEGLIVEPGFFKMFDYIFDTGDPGTSLANKNNLVLSKSLATKLFGDDEPVGKIIEMGEYKTQQLVTGVVDLNNVKSHLNAPFWSREIRGPGNAETSGLDDNWLMVKKYNYIKVSEDVTAEDIQFSLDRLVKDRIFPGLGSTMPFEAWFQRDDSYHLILQPLDDIYLNGTLRFDLTAGGNATTVNVLLAIAILIIVIASINFINLTTAHATRRAKEVGIKKTMGSTRLALVFQFMSESIMVSLMSMVIAFGLAEILLIIFEKTTGQALLDSGLLTMFNVAFAFLLAICVGILAGIYPAFYLSSFNPNRVLKGDFYSLKGNPGFRDMLVIFQFSLSMILIICSLIIFQQLEYMKTKDLGFDKEDVLIINNSRILKENINTLKSTLAGRSEVKNVGIGHRVPGSASSFSITTLKSENIEEPLKINRFRGDYDYFETIGFDLIEGRFFSRDISSDSSALILTQAAAKALQLDNPVGARLNNKYHVIGIVRDFNFESLRKKIEPAVFALDKRWGKLVIKVNATQTASLLTFIEQEWKTYSPDEPLRYHFLDDNFDELMRNDIKMGQVVMIFTILAMLIACLGLFGLSAYIGNQRRKEIGIRKVMGASVNNILVMLNKDFARLILFATLIAFPVSIYIMGVWLSNFAYSTTISAGVFILAGGLTLLVALFSVSYQSIAAATSDPVNSLKEV